MSEVYEYRKEPNRKVTWVAACLIGFLFGYGLLTSSPKILGLVWGLIALSMLWLLMKSPVLGIQLDHEHLTLAAWRNPRPIPLSDIDYIQVGNWTDVSDVTIYYHDGTSEHVPYGDLPDMPTFIDVANRFGVTLIQPDKPV